MPKFIGFFIIFLLFLCLAPNEGKAEEALTWEDCIKEARKNHPDLASQEEKLNQAKTNRTITTSNLLPQISSNLSAKTSKDRTDTYSYGITGRQLLFDGFKTPYNVAVASRNIKSAEYNYAATSSNVRLALRTAFIELLRTQELLKITEDIAQRRKKNLELVKLRYEAGREHRGSLLTAQANLSEALFEVQKAKRNINLALRRLNSELGRTKFRPIKVKGDFKIKYTNREKPNFESLAETNPLLQKLIVQKEAKRFGLKSAKADFFPQIYANASAGRTASYWPPEGDEWSVGVNLSLPLFEGRSRIAEVSRAKSAFKEARADERSGRDSVILTLEETWIKLQDAMDKVEVQKKFLEAIHERAMITQSQYSSGLISFDNWTIIEDDLVKTKKSFLDTQANALIAEANWVQAKGGTLDYEE